MPKRIVKNGKKERPAFQLVFIYLQILMRVGFPDDPQTSVGKE